MSTLQALLNAQGLDLRALQKTDDDAEAQLTPAEMA